MISSFGIFGVLMFWMLIWAASCSTTREEIGAARGVVGEGAVDPALVADLAEADVQRDLAQERHAELLGLAAGAAAAEEVDALVARAARRGLAPRGPPRPGAAAVLEVRLHVEEAHVLDHPQDRHLELAEHRQRADGVQQRHLLRRADDHGARQRQGLGEGQGDVAGAGGQVDDEVVELAPFDLVEELLHDPVEHRPAHDDGALGLEQEAHRHELQAVGLDRLDPVALGHRPAGGADEVGDRRAVDVGVHQADRRAVGLAGRRRSPRPSCSCRRRPCPSRRRSRSSRPGCRPSRRPPCRGRRRSC